MLNLSEILPVHLVDRLCLSVAVTYLRQILHIWSFFGTCGQSATVSRGIWQTASRNLEKKNAAENCGHYSCLL